MITVHIPYDPNRVTTRAPIFGIRTNQPTNHPDSSPEILKRLEEIGSKVEEVKDKQSAHADVLQELQSRKMPEIPVPTPQMDAKFVQGALDYLIHKIDIPPSDLPFIALTKTIQESAKTIVSELRVFHERNTESFADMREFLAKNMPVQTPVVLPKPSRLPWLMCGAIVAIDLLGHIKW